MHFCSLAFNLFKQFSVLISDVAALDVDIDCLGAYYRYAVQCWLTFFKPDTSMI